MITMKMYDVVDDNNVDDDYVLLPMSHEQPY